MQDVFQFPFHFHVQLLSDVQASLLSPTQMPTHDVRQLPLHVHLQSPFSSPQSFLFKFWQSMHDVRQLPVQDQAQLPVVRHCAFCLPAHGVTTSSLYFSTSLLLPRRSV